MIASEGIQAAYQESVKEFSEKYRELFQSEPEFVVFQIPQFKDVHDDFLIQKFVMQEVRNKPSDFECTHKSYCLKHRNSHDIQKENRESFDAFYEVYFVIFCKETSSPIGYFRCSYDSVARWLDIITDFWFYDGAKDAISLQELLRVIYTFQLLTRFQFTTTARITLPWPDDPYWQDKCFSEHNRRLVETLPNVKSIATTMIKSQWSENEYWDRFDRLDYKVIECLPEDIYHSPTLLEFLSKMLSTPNDYPTSYLPSAGVYKFPEDTNRFKTHLWQQLLSKHYHLLIFLEENELIGYLNYFQEGNGKPVSIRALEFINNTYAKKYCDDIMQAFLYESKQSEAPYIAVTVKTDTAREFYSRLGFNIIENHLLVGLPKIG